MTILDGKTTQRDSAYFNVLIHNIWFKTKNRESTERRETSYPKETEEITVLHKHVFNKIMTTAGPWKLSKPGPWILAKVDLLPLDNNSGK